MATIEREDEGPVEHEHDDEAEALDEADDDEPRCSCEGGLVRL